MNKNPSIKNIAFLTACASVLQITESLIPHPIPGIRLGLANMITLVTLVNLGFKPALEVAVSRTIISSFILGTFLSPAFLLSFSGSVTSTLIMGLVYELSQKNFRIYFSIFGISLLGAFTHNITQISLVYLILIKHSSVFLLFPWIGLSSIIMGWITGLVTSQVSRKLENPKRFRISIKKKPIRSSSFKLTQYSMKNSIVHRMKPAVKITIVILVALLVFIINNLFVYTIILIFLLFNMVLAKVPSSSLFLKLKKLSPILGFSFFMPVLFQNKGTILMHLEFIRITDQGLLMGSSFLYRILLLMVSAFLLINTTTPEELTFGLRRFLSPLKIIGISQQRIADILVLSWQALPRLWDEIRHLIKHRNPQQKRFWHIIPVLSDIIVTIYIHSDKNKNSNNLE